MKLFSVFSGCFRLFSVVLLLSVVFGIYKDPLSAAHRSHCFRFLHTERDSEEGDDDSIPGAILRMRRQT